MKISIELYNVLCLEIDDTDIRSNKQNVEEEKDNLLDKKYKFINYNDDILTIGDIAKWIKVRDIYNDKKRDKKNLGENSKAI